MSVINIIQKRLDASQRIGHQPGIDLYTRALAAATADFEVDIVIEPQDISDGTPEDCEHCPIALAACRAYGLNPLKGDHVEVVVDSDGKGNRYGLLVLEFWQPHWVCDVPERITRYLPERAMRFVSDFDADVHVEPFSFRPLRDKPVAPELPAPAE